MSASPRRCVGATFVFVFLCAGSSADAGRRLGPGPASFDDFLAFGVQPEPRRLLLRPAFVATVEASLEGICATSLDDIESSRQIARSPRHVLESRTGPHACPEGRDKNFFR